MKTGKSTLFIFSGLPGSGKTMLSQLLAQHTNSIYLRIDTVEQGLRDLCQINVQGEGYRLAYRIASDNLKLGISVVADSCNPISLTRQEWQQVAHQSDANYINIEIVCSDKSEHKKRLESRQSTIAGLILPSWKDVENREYHPWETQRVLIDTANKEISESFKELTWKLNTDREEKKTAKK